MPDDVWASKNSSLRRSTETCGKRRIISANRRTRDSHISTIIVAIIVIFLAITDALPLSGRSHQRTIRLCSKSLSDALYLVCHDRGGYNEPFSYSGEDNIRSPAGPGLVEECCYHSCSYEQLEQYCKPINDKTNGNVNNSQGGIEESLRIVNLPYTPRQDKLAARGAR